MLHRNNTYATELARTRIIPQKQHGQFEKTNKKKDENYPRNKLHFLHSWSFSDRGEVKYFESFLTKEECTHIRQIPEPLVSMPSSREWWNESRTWSRRSEQHLHKRWSANHSGENQEGKVYGPTYNKQVSPHEYATVFHETINFNVFIHSK